jgi:hypothetical protein
MVEVDRLKLLEDRFRKIVHEEITAAFRKLMAEAEHQDRATWYESGHDIEAVALSALGSVAKGVVKRLECPHETMTEAVNPDGTPDGKKCYRCNEPEKEIRS